MERIADQLESLQQKLHRLKEENSRYAHYVLAATQSLKHMADVVESADPAFAVANGDRARAAAAAASQAQHEKPKEEGGDDAKDNADGKQKPAAPPSKALSKFKLYVTCGSRGSVPALSP